MLHYIYKLSYFILLINSLDINYNWKKNNNIETKQNKTKKKYRTTSIAHYL